MKQTEEQFPAFDGPALIRKQISHWDMLFSGRLDQTYVSHVRNIGSIHRCFDVSLPFYILTCGLFLNVFERILRFRSNNQADTLDLMSGFKKFVMPDLAIGYSTDDMQRTA